MFSLFSHLMFARYRFTVRSIAIAVVQCKNHLSILLFVMHIFYGLQQPEKLFGK